MAKFLKKGSLGMMTEAPGGTSDPELAEIRLTPEEYFNLMDQIRGAKQAVYKARADADEREITAYREAQRKLELYRTEIQADAEMKIRNMTQALREAEEHTSEAEAAKEELEEALAKQMEQEMEEEEMQEEIQIPEEKEQVLEEEIQNSQKVTEMNIVDDSEVKEPPKTIESQKEDERQVGAVNEDRGSDDITKPTEQAHQEVVQTIVEPPKEEKKEEPKPQADEVFQSAAHMPSYPGGDAALMKYLSDHLRYPQAAADNNIQGKVIVQFVVEKNGKIGEVKVARSVDKDLDREAIRVCKSLPAFSPGRNAVGDPVRVWYTLPVTFKLQGVN